MPPGPPIARLSFPLLGEAEASISLVFFHFGPLENPSIVRGHGCKAMAKRRVNESPSVGQGSKKT